MMPITHLLCILLVVIIWGFNFLFVKIGLDEISPLLLCALRFFFASIPAIFFVKRPKTSFKTVVLYGLVMFALQFGFLFVGINAGMTPGMASLIMQVQIFFSMFFAALFLKEMPSLPQVLGAGISFLGIALVALHVEQSLSVLGFICILGAAVSWGFGNLITKKLSHINMLSLIVWGSFIACIPMALLSLWLEGTSMWLTSWQQLSWRGTSALIYIVYASTWIGYGIWNWLVNHYAIGTIVPFALLVPIVGILGSVFLMHESFELWKLEASLLVMAGLALNIFGNRWLVAKQTAEVS